MALLDVKATVRLSGVYDLLGRLARIDTRKVFTELKGPATFDLRHHWRKDEAPQGHWPGLAASTLARRTRRRGRDKNGKNRNWPKKLLGRFPTAIQHIVSKHSLVVRSRVKRFSMIHQAGGVAGHGARIPSRQYMWISKFLGEQARKAFVRALQAVANRGP
jgi:phage gpG-like protein